MAKHPYVQTGAALGLTGVLLAGSASHVDSDFEHHPPHAPMTYFANAFSTSTSAVSSGAAFDCLPFRVQYTQAIETLVDEVSNRLPRSPITFVLP